MKLKLSHTIILTIGLVGGYLLNSPSSPKDETDSDEISQLKVDLAEATTEIEELKEKTARLEVSIIEYENAPQLATAIPVVPSESKSDRRNEMMIRGMERYMRSQITILKNRLGLNADQEAQFSEIHKLMAAGSMKIIDRHNKGERPTNPEDAKDFVTQADINDLAAEILSEDQLSEYNKIQEERMESGLEMMSTGQANRLAPLLGLSEEQKDLVYAATYDHHRQMADRRSEHEEFDYNEMKAQLNKSIEEILDESQLPMFQDMQEEERQQSEEMKKLWEKKG